jgi:hypothetical protein
MPTLHPKLIDKQSLQLDLRHFCFEKRMLIIEVQTAGAITCVMHQ